MNAPPDPVDAGIGDIGEQLFGRFDEAGKQISRGLLDILRDAGLHIGVREQTAVAVLIAHLLSRTQQQPSLADFRADLAPLLARSIREREQLFLIFDLYTPRPVSVEEPYHTSNNNLASESEISSDVKRGRKHSGALNSAVTIIRKQWLPIGAALAIATITALFVILYSVRGTNIKTPTENSGPQSPIPLSVKQASDTNTSPSLQATNTPAKLLVDRVFAAARGFDGAPSLDELSHRLSELSPIGWSADAYAQRLQELTGLPRYQPLALSGIGTSDGQRNPEILARVSLALSRIEQPGRQPKLDELRAESFGRDLLVTFGDTNGLQHPEQLLRVVCPKCRGAGDPALHASLAGRASAILVDPFTAETLAERINKQTAINSPPPAAAGPATPTGPQATQQRRTNSFIRWPALAPVSEEGAVSHVRALLGQDGHRYSRSAILRALALTADPQVHRVLPDTQWMVNVPQQNIAKVPKWAPWLIAATPLTFILYWIIHSLLLRKAFLRRRAPQTSPLYLSLVTDVARMLQTGGSLFQRVGQRLQRRTPAPSDRLDVEATIFASINCGGDIIAPRFAHARAAAEYLVLIEKRGERDQLYDYMRSLVTRLKDVVTMDCFSYQYEPSLLEPENGGRAIPIERLAATFPNHRLLILGSGTDFLDPVNAKPLAGAALLAQWRRRALLTPVPLSEWAREELDLARELSLPIGRATPEGFLALAGMFGLEGVEDTELLDISGDGLARPLPSGLRLSPGRYLYSAPPDDHLPAQLVRDLRNYLDGPAFEWLCALAVYPALQWDLTLYLGLALKDQEVEVLPRPLYSEERVAALAQLPWLREGRFPDWLRRELIAAMGKRRADGVRSALQRIIEDARSADKASHEDTVHIRFGKETTSHTSQPEPYDDDVLLNFMAQGRIEDFELPSIPLLSRFLPRSWTHRLGWPETLLIGFAVTYALGALILSPKPSDGVLVNGAWTPVIAIGVSLGVLAFAFAVDKFYARIRKWFSSFALSAFAVACMLTAFSCFAYLKSTDAALPAFLLSDFFEYAFLAITGFTSLALGGWASARAGVAHAPWSIAGTVASVAFAEVVLWSVSQIVFHFLEHAGLTRAQDNMARLFAGLAVVFFLIFVTFLAAARFASNRGPQIQVAAIGLLERFFDSKSDSTPSRISGSLLRIAPYGIALFFTGIETIFAKKGYFVADALLKIGIPFNIVDALGVLLTFVALGSTFPLAEVLAEKCGAPPEVEEGNLFVQILSTLVRTGYVVATFFAALFLHVSTTLYCGVGAILFLLFVASRPAKAGEPRDVLGSVIRASTFLVAVALFMLLPGFFLRERLAANYVRIPPAVSHTTEADLIATTKNGRMFALGSADGTIRVFDTNRATEPQATLHALGGRLLALAIEEGSDNTTSVLAATQGDRNLQGWFVNSEGRAKPFHTRTIAAENGGGAVQIALGSQRSDWAASMEDNYGQSWILTEKGGQPLRDGGPVTALASLGDGRFIYGALNGSLGLISSSSAGVELRPARPVDPDHIKIRTGGKKVVSASYSAKGERILAANEDGHLTVWDVASRERVAALIVGRSISDASLSPDGSRLLVVSDKRVSEWDIASKKRLFLFGDARQPVVTATYSGIGHEILTSSLDHTARIWDENSGTLKRALKDYSRPLLSAEFSVDGTRVVTASADSLVRIWDVSTEKEISSFEREGSCRFAALSPDNSRVFMACGNGDGMIERFQGFDSALHPLSAAPASEEEEEAVGDAPSHDSAPSSSRDSATMKMLDKPMTSVPFARAHSGVNIYGDAYTWWAQAQIAGYSERSNPSTGAVMVLSGYSTSEHAHAAVVRRIVSSREIRIDHANWLNNGAIFMDDPVADVSAANDWSRVLVWNVETHAWSTHTYVVQGFIGPGRVDSGTRLKDSANVQFAEFSSSGNNILTISRDGIARIWDAVSGEKISEIDRKPQSILDAHFSPDNANIIMALDDGTVRVTSVNNGHTYQRGISIRSVQIKPESGQFIAVDTAGAILEGQATSVGFAQLRFSGVDDHLTLGPAVVWQGGQRMDSFVPVAPPFRWPVSGRIILDFGATLAGEKNDGINIEAPEGTPVRAAASGTVTYAGNELKGYGNLILIRHADNYITAYTHLAHMTVKRGEPISAGGVIGSIGHTGDVTTPQLHFETRRGATEIIDPKTLLPSATGLETLALREATPFALRLNALKHAEVINRQFETIPAAHPQDYAGLPVFEGDLPSDGAALATMIAAESAISSRLEKIIGVSGRRWNLELDGDVIVQLPETGWQNEIFALSDLIVNKKILERDISIIDLRSAGTYAFMTRSGRLTRAPDSPSGQ